jgi:hypothetical protein
VSQILCSRLPRVDGPHRLDAEARVIGISGAAYQKFRAWDDALEAYRAKYNQGLVRVVPTHGGPFDTHSSHILGAIDALDNIRL